jgi:ADP-heptose:LPS heptosyltransferase
MRPREILIIKPSSMGDVLQTLPAVHCLKRAYPEAKLRWIVNAEWAPLLAGNPDLAQTSFQRRSRTRPDADELAQFLRERLLHAVGPAV